MLERRCAANAAATSSPQDLCGALQALLPWPRFPLVRGTQPGAGKGEGTR